MLGILRSYKEEKISLKTPLLPALLLLLVLIIGTVGYHILWQEKGSSLIDDIYMTMITITTVGYQEVHELDTAGRFFTIFISIAGIGSLFYVLSVIMENLFVIQLHNIRGKRKMQKKIDKLSDHIILVGYGRVGLLTAQELMLKGRDFVVISETFKESHDELKKKGFLVVEGDATEDEVLLKSGIDRASGIIVATARSSTTVYVVLSAKVLNPDIHIVARADDENVIEKLRKAGASRIVNPYAIGGLRLANLMINPNVVEFFESSNREEYENLSIENIELPPGNFCVGKTLIDLDIRRKSGATVIAVIRDKHPNVNPDGKFQLMEGDRLLAMGTREQVKNLERRILGEE